MKGFFQLLTLCVKMKFYDSIILQSGIFILEVFSELIVAKIKLKYLFFEIFTIMRQLFIFI